MIVPLFGRGIILPVEMLAQRGISENSFVSMGFKVMLMWSILASPPDVVGKLFPARNLWCRSEVLKQLW